MLIDDNIDPKKSSGASLGLGIAGLVLGILTVVIAFIPCFGMYAIYPGAVGLSLSVISIYLAAKSGEAKGMAIAGLICAIIGCTVSAYQYYLITKSAYSINKSLQDSPYVSDTTSSNER